MAAEGVVPGADFDGRPLLPRASVQNQVCLPGNADVAGDGHHFVPAVSGEVFDPFDVVDDISRRSAIPKPVAGRVVGGQPRQRR